MGGDPPVLPTRKESVLQDGENPRNTLYAIDAPKKSRSRLLQEALLAGRQKLRKPSSYKSSLQSIDEKYTNTPRAIVRVFENNTGPDRKVAVEDDCAPSRGNCI